MQVLLNPKDIAPQLLHLLKFDLKELKPNNPIRNNKRGIRNKSRKILPKKLIKNLNPNKENNNIVRVPCSYTITSQMA